MTAKPFVAHAMPRETPLNFPLECERALDQAQNFQFVDGGDLQIGKATARRRRMVVAILCGVTQGAPRTQ